MVTQIHDGDQQSETGNHSSWVACANDAAKGSVLVAAAFDSGLHIACRASEGPSPPSRFSDIELIRVATSELGLLMGLSMPRTVERECCKSPSVEA